MEKRNKANWIQFHNYTVTTVKINIFTHNIHAHAWLHRAICNILLHFNPLRLANNILVHWCWLLLMLLVGCYQGMELLAFGFLPHNRVMHHITNHCCDNE